MKDNGYLFFYEVVNELTSCLKSQGNGLSFSTFTHAIMVVVIGCSAVRRRYRATDGVKDPADAPQPGRIPPERGKIGAA